MAGLISKDLLRQVIDADDRTVDVVAVASMGGADIGIRVVGADVRRRWRGIDTFGGKRHGAAVG
jgi:hypothetical protein